MVEVDRVGGVALDNADVVISRVGGLVLHGPGAIAVVSDFRNDQGEGRIFNDDIEEITTGGLGSAISIGGVDGEVLRLGGLVSILETRSIGPALVRAGEGHGLTDVYRVGSLGNVGTGEGDLDDVISRVDGVVGTGVGTVSVIEYIAVELLAIRISNSYYVRVSTYGDQVTNAVAGLDGEDGRSVALSAFQTRAIAEALGGIGLSLVDENTERAGLDVLSTEGDADDVVTSFTGSVGDLVGTIAIIGSGGGESGSRGGSNLDGEVVASDRDTSVGSVAGLYGERSLDTGLISRLQTRTVRKALSGDRSTLKELLLSATSLHIEVISVVRDVGHVGQLIRLVDHIVGIQ